MRDKMKEKDICEYMEWDSDFFNRKIARINARNLESEIMKNAIMRCRNQGIECIYFLVDVEDRISIESAEKNNFHLVDIRIELEKNICEAALQDTSSGSLRFCTQDDLPALKAIARISHRDSRFYRDGNFLQPICDNFYEKWIENSCNGYANAVLITHFQEHLVGYISCHLGSPGEGSIGLLAVHPDFREKGFAKLLINGATNWFKGKGVSQATVATQGINYKAQRLYQKCGFRTKSVHIWYHLWLNI